MNLVLSYCWKEWRAQRALLLAYAGLIFTCLCLGLSLAPTHYWFEEGFGVHALSWFVTAGVIGVVGFVAPGLVCGEYGPKEDLFVRRLPGALWSAFGGKLLFLILATLLLPLLGLLIGEIFVQAHGSNWHDLFRWRWDGSVAVRWPGVLVGSGAGLLLVPWIWAIGTWMPGGRMAVGGVMLFVLLVGVGVFAVLRQSPGIESGIAWRAWLWGVAPVGLVVAAVSWGIGRRGGGAMRSARFGLLTASMALVPPSVWFGARAWDYHHPDLTQLSTLKVHGLSADGRFALASGAENENFCTVPLRIDLSTGRAEQLAGVFTAISVDLVRPSRWSMHGKQDFWRFIVGRNGNTQRVLDLATGQWTPIDYDDERHVPVLPPQLLPLARAQAAANTGLRAPGGFAVWFEAGTLCRATAAGEIVRTPWPEDRVGLMRAAGHGFWPYGGNNELFDVQGRLIATNGPCAAYVVRDQVVFVPRGGRSLAWQQQAIDGAARTCDALVGSGVLGLLDDDQLLCVSAGGRGNVPQSLFSYRPADGTAVLIAAAPDISAWSIQAAAPLLRVGSLLERDPKGRIWLRCTNQHGEAFLLLDADSRAIATTVHSPGEQRWDFQLLDWLDGEQVLGRNGAKIVRWDITTGVQTVLFPRL